MSASTVQSYDFKKAAQSLCEQVAKQGEEKICFGVLYDPVARPAREEGADQPKTTAEWRKQWSESRARSKAEGQRLLRLQVQDFIKWLQGQGVI